MSEFMQMYRAELLINLGKEAKEVAGKMSGQTSFQRMYEVSIKSFELAYKLIEEDARTK